MKKEIQELEKRICRLEGDILLVSEALTTIGNLFEDYERLNKEELK